jgi:tyrosine phenol-lyase
MKQNSAGVVFSIPYEIAVVRPLRQTTLKEREKALEAADYNTELLPEALVYIDLKTDGGVSSLSTAQLSSLMGGGAFEPHMSDAAGENQPPASLTDRIRKIFGVPYLVPCAQGRAAERIWAKLQVKEGSVVPGNMLFPSTRFHIESNGGKVIDVTADAAHDLYSDEFFKGNVDPRKLEAVFKEHGREKVSCVYVELCMNSCGGHPVSLENLREVKAIAAAHRVPVFLDACRILENSYLIKQREPGYHSRTVLEIVRETCSLAEGFTLSALKDFLVPIGGFIGVRDESSYRNAYSRSFLDGSQPPAAALGLIGCALAEIFDSESYVASRVEQVGYLWRRLKGGIPVLSPPGGHAVFIDTKRLLPHVPPDNHPAEALAAFIYHISGIRVTNSPPLAPSQTARGIELLRLAVPARRYLQGHMDDVAEAILYSYSHRDEIEGLKRLEMPGESKYQPSRFAPLQR